MTEAVLYSYLHFHFPKENERCEWKAFSNLKHAVAGSKGEDVISYVSAIANMNGGHLVIGVEDQSLSVLGISNFQDYTPENFPFRIIGNCTNLSSEGLYIDAFTTIDTGKTVWVLHIPRHSPRKPVLAHKTAWQRKGDNLIPLTPEREISILAELYRSDDWSAVICEAATIDDLDISAIEKARENYRSKFPEQAEEIDEWSNVTFLNKAKITIKNKITRTAIILLGKPESEHFVLPSEAKIRWILKDNNNVEKDYAIYSPPLLLNADRAYARIRNLKYRYMRGESLFPEEVDQYEPFVIREALNNCIAHQDYMAAGKINLVEKEDELIFTNVGTFIPGNVENVIKDDAPEELYRNPFLATAMFNLKMVDTIGSGIRRMFNFQRNRFFPLPEYDFSERKVKVTITGKVLDMNYAKVLIQNPDLSLEEIILLDKVQKRKPLTDSELIILRDKGLIEGRKPNVIISVKVAQTTGQKAIYSRQKAFEKQSYFDWIIEAIKHHGSVSRKDIEGLLWDKLSDLYNDKQKKTKIGNLISDLRRKGLIKNTGNDFQPIWVLAEVNDTGNI